MKRNHSRRPLYPGLGAQLYGIHRAYGCAVVIKVLLHDEIGAAINARPARREDYDVGVDMDECEAERPHSRPSYLG